MATMTETEDAASAASAPREGIEIFYLRRRTGRLIVQRIEMPSALVSDRLLDAILVAWGRIKNCGELDFLFAEECRTGKILVSKESLTYYTTRVTLEAKREAAEALMAPLA